MVRLKTTLSIILLIYSSLIFSQGIQTDTIFWGDGEFLVLTKKDGELTEKKEFRDGMLLSHLQQGKNGIFYGVSYFQNGKPQYKWCSTKVVNEDLISNYPDSLVPVKISLEFNQNGDTITIREYAAQPDIEAYMDFGELPMERRVDFDYFENGTLAYRKEYGRFESSFELNPEGWHRSYYDNGQLEREEFFLKAEQKWEYEYAEHLGQFAYPQMTRNFYENGQLSDSKKIEKNKIYRAAYYQNGNPSFKGSGSLEHYIESDEYEDYKEFDEDGTYTISNEKYIRTYRGDVLIEETKLSKNGEELYTHQFWDNGRPKIKLTRTSDEYFNKQGKLYYKEEYKEEDLYKDADEKPSAFRTYRTESRLELSMRHVKNMNKCTPSVKVDFSEVIAIGFEEDTLKFFDGKLFEVLYYNKDSTFLSRSYNYVTKKGYSCSIWNNKTEVEYWQDVDSNFRTYKKYVNGEVKQSTELIENISGKLIYEKWEERHDGVQEYEYRNYVDSTFYYVGGVYAYSDSESDSIVAKSIPEVQHELYYTAGDYNPKLDHNKWWHFDKNGELLRFTEGFNEGEIPGKENLTYVDSNFYKGRVSSVYEYYMGDSTILRKFSLNGDLIYFRKYLLSDDYYGPSQLVQEKHYSPFLDNNNGKSRVRIQIPNGRIHELGESKYGEDVIFSVNSPHVLVTSGSNNLVIDTTSGRIYYQDQLNLPGVSNSNLSLLYLHSGDLYFVQKNVLYHFERDEVISSDSLITVLSVKNDEMWFVDLDGALKKALFNPYLLEGRILEIEDLGYLYGTDERGHHIDNLLREPNIYLDYSENSFIYLNDGRVVKDGLKADGQVLKEVAGNYLYTVINDTIYYLDVINNNLNSKDLNLGTKRKEYNFKKYYDKESQRWIEEHVVDEWGTFQKENDLFFMKATFDDWYNNVGCCSSRINWRNYRYYRFDFRTGNLESAAAPDTNLYAFEVNYKSDRKVLEMLRQKTVTSDLYNAWKLDSLMYVQLEKGDSAVVIDLSNGISETSVGYGLGTFEQKKNSSASFAVEDIDLIKHFTYPSYNFDPKKLTNDFSISYNNDTNSDQLMVKLSPNYLRVHWNGQKEFPKDRIVGMSIIEKQPIFYTPDMYYMSGYGAEKHLSFQIGLNSYSFEQFDLKYNRPDIILDRLGYADSALVSAYHQAYQKRLKKMGFTEEMLEDDFHLPEIEIENFEEMPSLHDQGSINLKLKLQDGKYKLDRINVWVNDVAIYGTNGISLRDKNVQEYTTNLEVFLAKGNNKVQVSVLNQAGAESYKETFEVECTVGKTQPDLYLITIGESEFQQADFNLTYAAKDAKDMAALFEKSKVYATVHTKTLVNEQVTTANVKALKSFLQKADINDEVMVFIAGHGVLDANLDYYFATYDMDFQQPQEKGLAYEAVEGLLDGIKPLKKTLLIDACHSGEIDKEEVELAEADVKEEGDIQFRVVGKTATPKLGTQNTSELTKSLFTDLRKGTGATVISSAGGMEFAMEGDDWNNGLFTYCFIKGIQSKAADLNKDGEIWLSEIQQYVSQQVYELSGGRQQPTSRIENQTIDFRVW